MSALRLKRREEHCAQQLWADGEKKGHTKWQVTWWRCSSPMWPNEGAVGFDFRYPTGAPSCQDQNGNEEEKKHNRYENTEKEEVRKSETEGMMNKKKKKKDRD